MCIFAMPVQSVTDTRIYVAPNVNLDRQLTVYEMSVTLRTPGNAMILPVPGDVNTVELVDLSKAKDILEKLDAAFEFDPYSRSLSRGLTKSVTNDSLTLQVFEVGSYKVSLAATLDDLDRLDPEVFTVSDEAKAALRSSTRDGKFGFVVATLTQSGPYHPLAYIHDSEGPLFVPTRHEHGAGDGDMAEWDHTIFYVGPARSTWDTLGGRVKTARDVFDVQGNYLYRALLADVERHVPQIRAFIHPGAPIHRLRIKGQLRSADLIIPAPDDAALIA